jgi:hypothetical protein
LGTSAHEKTLTDVILQVASEKKPETVDLLVKLARETESASDKEILDTIIRVQNEEKLKLTPPPRQTLGTSAYLRTSAAHWYWMAMALAAATAIVVFTVPDEAFPLVYVRYVLGTVFVLWLPGYAFTRALFPQGPASEHGPADSSDKSEKDLDAIERTALSLGISLALVPIVGLLINYTPWGIRLTSVVLSLLALTVIFASAAVMREHQTRTSAQAR